MTDRSAGGHPQDMMELSQPSIALDPGPDGRASPGPAGDICDFTSLYEEFFEFVWRSVRRLGVPERALDDAVQDVFIVVHRRLDEFEGRSSVKSWLFGIARRVAHDHRRRASRKDRGESLPEAIADPYAPSPLESASRAQAVALLYRLLDALDDDKREVFILAELEQMTVPEIAEATSVNLNTAYSRLRAARRAFEQAIHRHQARERTGP
jgi:RNA polymerase sigma-70 factor, ECF subfamily